MGQRFLSKFTRFGRERRWQFNEWWDRYCTPTAQRIYARLPDDGSWLPLRQLTREFGIREANNAIEILQHIGLIAADEDELVFCYSGEMFRRWYRRDGILAESAKHDLEIHSRLSKFDSQLADKYLTAWQIYQAHLANYSGAVGEIRDVLTLLLNKIAPHKEVMAQPGFKLAANTDKPTRRQRVRYAVRQRYSKGNAKEIVSNFDLLETACEQLASIVTKAYGGASGLTHTTATREQVYRALKQWDSILANLVPIDSQSDDEN